MTIHCSHCRRLPEPGRTVVLNRRIWTDHACVTIHGHTCTDCVQDLLDALTREWDDQRVAEAVIVPEEPRTPTQFTETRISTLPDADFPDTEREAEQRNQRVVAGIVGVLVMLLIGVCAR